jgi:hypothetical protein
MNRRDERPIIEDLSRHLADWLRDSDRRELPDPESGLDRLITRFPTTPQRRRWWRLAWPGPRTDASRSVTSAGSRPAAHRRSSSMFGPSRLALLASVLTLTGVLAIGGLTFNSAPASPAILIVDADEPGGYATISAAVAAAADGDTVLVRPGTYSESIVIDKTLTLQGDGDRDAIVITTPPEGPDAIVDPYEWGVVFTLLLQESDATVSGLTFRGDSAGVLVRGGSPTLVDLHFDHVGSPFGSSLPGLGNPMDIHDGSSATVRENRFTVSGEIAVGGDSSPILEGNVLDGGTHIYLQDAGDGAVIRGNTISGTFSRGIGVFGATTTLI